ncbi:hypothetical protein ACE6H2_024579 [Prunus campanulata]
MDGSYQFQRRLTEVLWKLSSFGFSLLSPNDQQDNIEHISELLAVGVADVKRLEGETEEDLRRKKFADLFNKAPVYTQVVLFQEFRRKFFFERRLCEAILLFRQLDSNEQQERIKKLEGFVRQRREEVNDVILEGLSQECEEDFRLRRFIKICSTLNLFLDHFMRDKAKDWDLKSLHMQKSGKEEIEEIKQSRYAEFYLGLSIIWFKARCASDPKCLIHLIISKVGEGDHIIEKLVNEAEEDFLLRRFTESFKQLQFSTQEDVVKRIQDIIINDLIIPIPQPFPRRVTDDEDQQEEVAHEFMKVKSPNLKGSGGAAATQGGGQGASSSFPKDK